MWSPSIEFGDNGPHERLAFDGEEQIEIKEAGFVYIWLSNENDTPVEVYFDDFKVDHIKSPVVQADDYYPFGLTFNSYSRENSTPQNYLYNGKELQDELNLGWYDYQARQYDPSIARWMAIDPLSDLSRRWSPYAYCYNNPLLFVDPDGMFGDYYDSNGQHLGNDGKDDKKVYVAESVTKNKEGTVTSSTGAKDLGVTHDEFTTSANVVKHESSGDKTESLWIAHTANNAKDDAAVDYKDQNSTLNDQLADQDYSTTPASARTPLSDSDNSSSANNARAGVIDVLTGGADPTGGAVLWDGDDFLSKGESHQKFKDHTYVKISSDHLQEYSMGPSRPGKSIDGTFWVPIIFKTDYNKAGNSKKYHSIESTGAQGRSIFWKLGN